MIFEMHSIFVNQDEFATGKTLFIGDSDTDY
jgi:hypothetical protein